MKIAIFTFTSSQNNYGQLLQAYAMQRYLVNSGNDAFHVRYMPQKTNSAIRSISNLLDKLRDVRFIADRARRLVGRRADNRDREFDAFVRDVLHTGETEYRSITELRDNPPVADVYLAGSDQIWGVSLEDVNNEAWFLRFGSDKIRRIAYAASLGRRLNGKDLERYNRLLGEFDYISVREESAADDLLKAGVCAQVVLDPTLLLTGDDYREMLNEVELPEHPENCSDCMFAYILNVAFPSDVRWAEIKKYILAKGMAFIPAYSSGYYSAYPIIRKRDAVYPTIQQWLKYIDTASCVVTTSFHGAVFAILLHTPFVVIPLSGKRAGANDRLKTLLSSLNLSTRLLVDGTSFAETMDAPIDWNEVDCLLDDLRKTSSAYLEAALGEK